MKKALLAVIFVASVFICATPINTQAEEKLNIADVIYPNADNTAYYSLSLSKYASTYKKMNKNMKKFEHIRLTNTQTYGLSEYSVMYAAARREGSDNILQRAFEKLMSAKTPADLNIVQGEFKDGYVIAAEPTVKEFKVIDIK